MESNLLKKHYVISLIVSWINHAQHNDVLIFLASKEVDSFVIRYVNQYYPEKLCYWIIFYDSVNSDEIQQKYSDLFPHLENFAKLLNPLGTSIFIFNKNTQIWFSCKKIEDFLADFEYEPRLICDLQELKLSQIQSSFIKPWYQLNAHESVIQDVCIVGGGIAGAMTAYFLAEKGIRVILLERESEVAAKASGNYQGVMYAKVSPFDTVQTELLYQSYGLALCLLRMLDQQHWFSNSCGVLHLDYNEQEKKRNQDLARKNFNLFRYVLKHEATQLAGIQIDSNGLFWENGAWVQPKLWIAHMLLHPNITVKTNSNVIGFKYINNKWNIFLENLKIQLVADALVLALGSDVNHLYASLGLNLNFISGQTSLLHSNQYSQKLSVVLSGKSYILPAVDGIHCLGATFHPNNQDENWKHEDENRNLMELSQLNAKLYQSFALEGKHSYFHLKGHRAVRCDSFDHLPVIGSIGDVYAMRKLYAKLSLDKNYRVDHACPFLPNLYVNTAHGSRGLLTSVLGSFSLVAEMLDLPNPLGFKLRKALSPNRLIIHDIVKNKIN